MAQAILTAFFTLATIGLLCSALAALRSRTQGFLAGIVLLGLLTFLVYGASAYADVPVMFYFAATFTLFALQYESGVKSYDYLILAGATMGFAAWTKNEGLLFVLSIGVAHLAVTLRSKGVRGYLRELLFVSLGLLPVLANVLYFKTQLAPPNDLVVALGGQSLTSRLLDYHRAFYTLRELIRTIFYHIGYGVGLAYMLAIYMLCTGATFKHRHSLMQLSLTTCLMMVGYFLIYQTSSFDIAYHIRFTMDRLLLQQWPGFVLLYFLLSPTPEEFLGEMETPKN